MKNVSELIEKDNELQKMDEPSPPNAERTGLWRILAVSTILAIAALFIVWLFF
jgi:hypothetical protein